MIFHISLFEFRRLLRSPLPWITLAIIQLVLALLFYLFLSQYLQNPGVFAEQGITEIVVASFYQGAGPVLLLVMPFLTMRLFSEELRTGTMKLLLSSPVSSTALVIGKYFGMILFMLCLLTMVTLMPVSLMPATQLDPGQFASAVIGLTLLVSSAVAIGLLVSSLFRSPAIAAMVTFAVYILLWTVHQAGPMDEGSGFAVFNYLSLARHYMPFTEGLFAPADVFYFVVLTAACLVAGIWRLDSMRIYHW